MFLMFDDESDGSSEEQMTNPIHVCIYDVLSMNVFLHVYKYIVYI